MLLRWSGTGCQDLLCCEFWFIGAVGLRSWAFKLVAGGLLEHYAEVDEYTFVVERCDGVRSGSIIFCFGAAILINDLYFSFAVLSSSPSSVSTQSSSSVPTMSLSSVSTLSSSLIPNPIPPRFQHLRRWCCRLQARRDKLLR